jgi:starch synthase
MAISPMYGEYEGCYYQETKSFELFGGWHEVRYFHQWQDYGNGKGCDYVFLDHPCFHRAGGLYHDKQGEYGDNLFRFALFSLAALEVPCSISLGGMPCYGGKCLFIANDWQTGLVPTYLVHRHRAYGNYCDSRCIYVIHNLGYQGISPLKVDDRSNFDQLGLPGAAFNDVLFVYPPEQRGMWETGEVINLTKAGIICSDRILTVSPEYANEIRTWQGGFNLQDHIAAKGWVVCGILNGIDSSWNPATDSSIAAKFSVDDMSGKNTCKEALQKSLGLNADPTACIMSFVGRLTAQKGIDALGACMEWMMEDHKDGMNSIQLIIMGNGDACFGDMLQWAETKYKGRVCGYYGFSPKVEREMIAGSDFLLMPSRYEPCGIPQMCAMMYGTIPIVHRTGGLKDSVKNFYEGEYDATGFHIFPLDENGLKKVIFDALTVFYRQPESFSAMQRNAMRQDFSWPRAIDDYERHIDFTLYDLPWYGRGG